MTKYLSKCPKCGAVMVAEGYHQYGWYLDGKRVEGCPPQAKHVQVNREDLKDILAAIQEAEPHLLERHEYQRLKAALEGN